MQRFTAMLDPLTFAALYQGATSVVPKAAQNHPGLSSLRQVSFKLTQNCAQPIAAAMR
jgi:hypothetical protein